MQTVIVTSQAEWDALPKVFEGGAIIEIRSSQQITIKQIPGSSSVVAWGSSRVEAWGSSSVVARESSRVEAWGSSSVVAWGSSSVVARESSRVEAWGSSSVVARGSSRVEAWGRSSLHNKSAIGPHLHGQSVCFLYDGYGVPIRESDNATVIVVTTPTGVAGWIDENSVVEAGGYVVLFKRVSTKWLTQENTANETTWVVGEVKEHPSWNPIAECGGGQFHACSRPYFCDEFRSEEGDRYVAIKIAILDLHAWDNPQYPHKIVFRKGTVLYECDRWGEEIKHKETA